MELDTQTWPHSVGEEDCLYLNVYSPLDPGPGPAPATPLPVMVWIYGGGYSVGSGTWADYGPQKFLDTDQVPSVDVTRCYILLQVLLVTFNYRLGSLGWISLGQDEESVLGTVTSHHHDMT